MNSILIITAVGLGVAYAAAPGAVNTEAIRRGILHGAHSTLLVQAGALIGDAFWALLAMAGVTILVQHPDLEVVLGITGGCFLLRMAWLAFQEAFFKRASSSATASSTRGDFTTGVIFGVVNPFGLTFWSGLGSSVVTSGMTGTKFVLFFASFFAGAVGWSVAISAVIYWGRRWIRPALFRWINIFSGLMLGYFGVRVLWVTIREWLQHHFLGPAYIRE